MGPPSRAYPWGWGREPAGGAASAALEAAGSRGPSEPSTLSPPSSTSLVSPRPAADGFLEVWVMASSHEASPQRPTPLGVQEAAGGEEGRAGWARCCRRPEQWDPHWELGLGEPPDGNQSLTHLCSARITAPNSWFRVELA